MKSKTPPTTIGENLDRMKEASQKGKFDLARSIFDKLCANVEFTVEPETINTVIQAAANVGDVKEAKSWFKKFEEYDLNPTLESYTCMISAVAKMAEKKMANEAQEYFQQMISQDIPPDTVAYGALLAAFARVGDIERAEQYFEKMEQDGLKPNKIVFGSAT